MKDIQVFTALDAKTVAAEKLDILLLSTEGAADMAIYNDLEKLKAAFPGKKVAAMADKMFNQDNTLADTLIRKVRVAGIENPQNVGGTASRIEIAFGENMPTETLEASTAYYAKIGGKTVVEITTSEEVPVDCTGLAKLFAGTSFEEDGVKFTAAVDDNTVTYTSTTRTAVSGYAESISLYKDADCFEDMGLSGAVVSVSVGKADTTKAENLIAAIEDLRDHNDDWYFILTDVTDPVCVTALCKWAESTEPTEAALGAGVEDHRKFYFGQTNDKEYVNEYGRSVVTYDVDDYGLPPHSIEAVVYGGLDSDIAQIIYKELGAGIQTTGQKVIEVITASGATKAIHFNRPHPVPVYVKVVGLSTSGDFPHDGVDQLRAAIVAYIGDNESGGVSIGETLYHQRLPAVLYKVPGVLDFDVLIGTDAENLQADNIPVDSRSKVVTDDGMVTIDA